MTEGFKETEIGLIPEDWDWDKLENLTTKIATGSTPPSNVREYGEDGINFIRSSNIFDFYIKKEEIIKINKESIRFLKNSEVKSEDVLLNITGDGITFLRDCIVTDDILPAYTNQSIAIIRTNERINGRYLSYYLSLGHVKKYMEAFNAGSARRTLAAKHVKEFLVPFPQMKEQINIANIINSLNNKIDLNKQMNRTLEAIAKSIFRHWFVHFEFPDENGQPYKSSGGEIVNSELGEIPVGWSVKKLKDTSNITMGQSPKSEFYNAEGEGLPFHQGVTNFGERFPKDKMYCTVENKVAEYGDILFSVRAPVGRINIAKSKIVIGRGLSAIGHKKGFQSFLLYQLKNIFTEEDSMGSGTVFNAITRKDLDDLTIIVPNRDLDKQFNDFVSYIDKQIENQVLENENLSHLRDSLLPKLMSGKIRVKPTSI